MKKIKVGIWGLGRAGYWMQLPELAHYTNRFEVVAGCDIDPARLEALRAKLPSCRVYRRPEEFLKDQAVELVSIATRSLDHCADALRALAAQKYVFLEKPIAMTYAEARRLQRAAARYPGRLFPRHNRRFEAPFNHIREIIATGVLGEIFEIKLHRHGYQRRNDWQTLVACGGGQLNNWGAHIIDHALCLLEAPVANLWSDLKNIAAAGDAEDHVKIVLTGQNGRVVDLEISGAMALPQPEYIVFGSKGSLVCQGDTITMRYLNPRRQLCKIKPCAGSPPLEGGLGKAEVLPWVEKTVPVAPRAACDLHHIWEALFAAIRQGRPFPISVDQAVEVVRVTEWARKAAKGRCAPPAGSALNQRP